MKRILFLFNTGRIERLGTECPDEFYYGALGLDPSRFKVRMLGPHPPSQGLIGACGAIHPLPAPLRRMAWWLKRNRLPALTFVTRMMQIVFAGRQAVRDADLIVAVTSPWIFALNVLRRLRIVNTPFVGIAFGPFPAPAGVKGYAVALVRRALFRGAKVIFTGDADRENYLAHVCGRRADTALMYFGVDEKFWRPDATAKGDYAFAIGSAFRDYDTLLAAWRDRQTNLKIVSANMKADDETPDNVEIISGIWHSSALSDGDIRALFQAARYVVTPLHDTSRPAGQSATLQAMACGKAVIVSQNSGLWDPMTMVHLKNCYLVAPGDAAAMGAAIDYFDSNPDEVARIGVNARATVEQHYTTAIFTHRLEDFAEAMLEPPR